MKNLTATLCLTIAVLLGSVGVSSAGLFGPSNYDECVLDRMQGVQSDLAARVIIAACSSKFSHKEKRSPSPPKEKKPEYKPELDRNGLPVCRVHVVGDKLVFSPKEFVYPTPHTIWTFGGVGYQDWEAVLPNGASQKEVEKNVRSRSFEAYSVCRRYHWCKGGNIYACD
jgi:hypothetical protein